MSQKTWKYLKNNHDEMIASKFGKENKKKLLWSLKGIFWIRVGKIKPKDNT